MRVAVAQFQPIKGNRPDTLARLAQQMVRAAKDGAEVVVAPETALTGYFLEGGVAAAAVSLEQLGHDLFTAWSTAWDAATITHEQASPPPLLDVVVGAYESEEGQTYNSAIWYHLAVEGPAIVGHHRKVFLPTYGVFDEGRFVSAGESVQAFDTRWGRVALLVCEDAWHSMLPTIAAVDGAQTLLVLAASPARGTAGDGSGRPSNAANWERLLVSIAAEHGIWVISSHLVGVEGGKAFVGVSLGIDPTGVVRVRSISQWEPELLYLDTDDQSVRRARAGAPLLAHLRQQLPRLIDSLSHASRRTPMPVSTRGPSVYPALSHPKKERWAAASAMRHSGADPLAFDPVAMIDWLVHVLREEVLTRRHFSTVVLGLSGGIDSAVVAALAVRAFGANNVIGLRLPHAASSPASLADAALIATHLGIPVVTTDITGAVEGLVSALPVTPSSHRIGNIMARVRMIAIFDHGASVHALPLGTGNKSERLMGYFTWHADDSPPVNVLGDLFKVQVWALARALGLPVRVIEKPASADLVPGQTDESDFGMSYPELDFILSRLIAGWTAEEIADAGATPQHIAIAASRIAATHWKRRLPTTAMVSDTTIGEWYLRPVDFT